MSTLETLLARASNDVVTDPGPDDDVLRTLVDAALRAPDHGKLRPWRFLVIRGEARHRLSEILVRALQRREPGASEASIAKERERPFRAPVLVALIAHVTPSAKVPEIEQLLSTAAAAMNMLNAAHALGWGAVWKTGAAVYDPFVHAELGLAGDDRLLGFLYLGTPAGEQRVRARPEATAFFKEWR